MRTSTFGWLPFLQKGGMQWTPFLRNVSQVNRMIQRHGNFFGNHPGPHIRYVLRHLNKQISVPHLSCRYCAVNLPGNDFEDAFQAGVEPMNIESHRIEIDILVP